MIEPTDKTLQTLFADRVFRIPHYQRFYSWQKKQREDLFNDLRKLAERNDDNHHFMATIVCHKTDEVTAVGANDYRLYDVVDGQQRLTSLIMILKCIELSLDDPEVQDDLAKTIVKKDGNLILLQTNNANEHIFNAFLRDGAKPTAEQVTTRADRAIRDGINQCESFVLKWREDNGEAMSLLRLVVNKLGFVIFDIEDPHSVYSIFEVLNSRGLAVDYLDKCKSMMMERTFKLAGSEDAANAAIATLQNIWAEIYREIADINVSGEQILRVAGTLYFGQNRGKPRPADESLESFRNACDGADKPRVLAGNILDVAKKLVALQKNIFLGPVTEVLHARILAIAILSADTLTDPERAKAMEQWERVTFRIFQLFGKDSREAVGKYVRLAAAITNKEAGGERYSEIMKSLRKLGSKYPIEEAVEEGLVDVSVYEWPHFVRFVLWKYEEHLANEAGQGSTVDENVRAEVWASRAEDSIEHIFPQNPEQGGAWDGRMVDAGGIKYEVEEEVGRIGNLLLLPIKLNMEARRQGFDLKKPVYEKHNLRMVREILDDNDLNWGFEAIVARENKIVEWAKTEWADLPD